MDLAKKMDLLVSLCKRRGFVYADSDIYGGFANAWDYGPYGVELKNNIRDAWWQMFVRERDDVVGVDTPVIQHPKIWEASGHLSGFSDPLVEDKKTHKRYRLDHLLEGAGADISGFTFEQMAAKMAELKLRSPDGNELSEPKQFNLMFQTSVGVSTDTSIVFTADAGQTWTPKKLPSTRSASFLIFDQRQDNALYLGTVIRTK